MVLEGDKKQSFCVGEDTCQDRGKPVLDISAAESLPGCGSTRAPKPGEPEAEKSQEGGHETPGGPSGHETQLPQCKFLSCLPGLGKRSRSRAGRAGRV